MIIHRYVPGDHLVTKYYGHGLGSLFAKLFSKIASKTASTAALSVAKKAGSRLVKAGMKKVVPVAKNLIKSSVEKGVEKVVPIAKDLVKKGVKRASDEAQSMIISKVKKIEKAAIRKGVSPNIAHILSASVQEGSNRGIDRLSHIVNDNSDKIIGKTATRLVNELNDPSSITKSLKSKPKPKKVIKPKKTIKPKKVIKSMKLTKSRALKSGSSHTKSQKDIEKERRQRVSYDLQNLVDSA